MIILGPILFKLLSISRHLGALQGPILSAFNFFQTADLFANLDIPWPQTWKRSVAFALQLQHGLTNRGSKAVGSSPAPSASSAAAAFATMEL